MQMGTIMRKNIFKVRAYRPISVDDVRKRHPGVSFLGLKPIVRGDGLYVAAGQVFSRLKEMGVQNPTGLFSDYLKWAEQFENLVVNAGLDDSLDKHLKGSSYTAAFYIGLTDGTPTPAAADTMASHAGWTEVTAYDEANRVTLTLGSVSGQSVDNVGNEADFTISANDTTVGGAFVTTANDKGGSTGTLYGVGAFSAGDKTLDDNDTLQVTITCTASAS